jgi:hydroxymethylglutaryl-CoA reductase
MVKATCVVPSKALAHTHGDGDFVARRIVQAWEFAWFDIYRAATHNKGIMNGIDPIVIATGNDWRAVEAGAHAFSARTGTYRPLSLWKLAEDGALMGHLEMPLSVGTVGGVTKLHPSAQISLKILGLDDPSRQGSACKLAEIMMAVGLAQNLSALRALAVEGIQRGHMGLHKKNMALFESQQNTQLH